MFAAIKSLAAPVAKFVAARGTKILGKKTAAVAGATMATAGATGMLARTAPTGLIKQAAIATGGAALGSALAGGEPRRRRRRRRFPTANQMARFEMAKDMVKGNPTMRRALEWKFFSRYSWF